MIHDGTRVASVELSVHTLYIMPRRCCVMCEKKIQIWDVFQVQHACMLTCSTILVLSCYCCCFGSRCRLRFLLVAISAFCNIRTYRCSCGVHKQTQGSGSSKGKTILCRHDGCIFYHSCMSLGIAHTSAASCSSAFSFSSYCASCSDALMKNQRCLHLSGLFSVRSSPSPC